MKVRTYTNIVVALSETQLFLVYRFANVLWVKMLLAGLMVLGVIIAAASNIILRDE